MWTAGARLGMGQSVSSDERSNLISSFRTDARSFIPIAFNLDRRDLLSSTADLRGRTGSVADRALAHNRERTIYFLVASGPVFRRAPSLGAFRGDRLSKMQAVGFRVLIHTSSAIGLRSVLRERTYLLITSLIFSSKATFKAETRSA